MSERTALLLTALRKVDWPLTLQVGGTLLRALRGDPVEVVATDGAQAQERVRKLRAMIESTARQALGCLAPSPCTCAICTEIGAPQ